MTGVTAVVETAVVGMTEVREFLCVETVHMFTAVGVHIQWWLRIRRDPVMNMSGGSMCRRRMHIITTVTATAT